MLNFIGGLPSILNSNTVARADITVNNCDINGDCDISGDSNIGGNLVVSGSLSTTSIPNLEILIRAESDFATELNPRGVLSNVLLPNNTYKVDVTTLVITRPFWLKYEEPIAVSEGITLEAVNRDAILVYVGTAPMFYARNLSAFILDKFFIINGSIPGTQLFDLQGTLDSSIFSFVILLSGGVFGPWNLGLLRNISGIDFERITYQFFTQGLTLDTIGQFILRTTDIVTTGGGAVFQYLTNFMGVAYYSDSSIINQIGDAYISIDSGIAFTNQLSLNNLKYSLGGGDFYQGDLGGSITAFTDLGPTISGTIQNITSDQSGNFIIVTLSGSGTFENLALVLTGTANYNGTHRIACLLQETPNHIVYLDTPWIADELAGSYAANAIQVTTSTGHALTYHRSTLLAGTTNYNATYEVLNPGVTTFTINETFVADDATGAYLTSSLDQTNKNLSARDNGASRDSQIIGNSILTTTETVAVTTTLTRVSAGTWTSCCTERFSVDSEGILTYEGIHPVNLKIAAKIVLQKVSGSPVLGNFNIMCDQGSGFMELPGHPLAVGQIAAADARQLSIPTITNEAVPGDRFAIGISSDVSASFLVSNVEFNCFD